MLFVREEEACPSPSSGLRLQAQLWLLLLMLRGRDESPVSERMKEHKQAVRELDADRSVPARHVAETGHAPNFEDVKTLSKEERWMRHVIKAALWTQKLGSSDAVKHTLGHCWHF